MHFIHIACCLLTHPPTHPVYSVDEREVSVPEMSLHEQMQTLLLFWVRPQEDMNQPSIICRVWHIYALFCLGNEVWHWSEVTLEGLTGRRKWLVHPADAKCDLNYWAQGRSKIYVSSYILSLQTRKTCPFLLFHPKTAAWPFAIALFLPDHLPFPSKSSVTEAKWKTSGRKDRKYDLNGAHRAQSEPWFSLHSRFLTRGQSETEVIGASPHKGRGGVGASADQQPPLRKECSSLLHENVLTGPQDAKRSQV